MTQVKIYLRKDFPPEEGPCPDFFEWAKIDQALVKKVSKPKQKKRKSDNKPFFTIDIETNYGKYSFINLEIIPEIGHIVEFIVTDGCWMNARDLNILGSLSKEELQAWKERKIKIKAEKKRHRKELVQIIELGKPYYSKRLEEKKYTFFPIRKGQTRIRVEKYESFYLDNKDYEAQLLQVKWVYPETLSKKPYSFNEQKEPEIMNEQKQKEVEEMVKKWK